MENIQMTTNTEMSPTIGQLALALSKAQGAMTSAAKNSNNPFYKSKYADLAQVWDTIRKPLSDNELAVIQTIDGSATAPIIITYLTHSSGEWVRSKMTLIGETTDKDGKAKISQQTIGSAIAYGRRYSLSAVVGVSQADDDGNEESQNEVVKDLLTKEQSDILKNKIASTKTDLFKFLNAYKIDSIESMPKAQFKDALTRLQKKEGGSSADH